MITSNLRTVTIRTRPQTFLREVAGGNFLVTSTRSGIVYPEMKTKAVAGEEALTFIFPFPPTDISYSDMAPEISEISRPGKKSLVHFSRPKLKKASMNFLVAVPFDGLQIEIEQSLQLLQRMANRGTPVFFKKVDRLLTSSFSGERSLTVSYWNISDLSFNSVRRTDQQRISQASVSMSLIENENPSNIRVTSLPRIEYTATPVVKNPRPTRPEPPSPNRWGAADQGQNHQRFGAFDLSEGIRRALGSGIYIA